VTDEEERELRIAVMQADHLLKTRQAMWETPRNIALIAAAVATIAAALGGWIGYSIGSAPSAQVIQLPPGTTITVPTR
jgi:membrane protein YqaA with SNARE-associated domain